MGAAEARDIDALMSIAAERGHLRMVKWLIARFGVGAADACIRYALGWACEKGHRVLAMWLTRQFGLGPADVPAGVDGLLYRMCASGHLETIRWLVDAFGIDLSAARVSGMLLEAGERGHTHVAAWLAERCVFPSETTDRALRYAAMHRHLTTAQWLVEHFGAPPAEKWIACNALRVACSYADLAMAQWLTERFELGPADALRCGALHIACHRADLATVRWIMTQFGLGPDDARAIGGHAHENVSTRYLANDSAYGYLPPQPHIARWLARHRRAQ